MCNQYYFYVVDEDFGALFLLLIPRHVQKKAAIAPKLIQRVVCFSHNGD